MTKAIIIGAGIGGLATANLLAAGGYQVSIYEKNTEPGGRAGRLKIDDFVFDTGPSWYLMPEVFEHYFKLLGKDINKLLQLQRLEPAYQVFFEQQVGSQIIHADLAKDRTSFEQMEKGAGKQLDDYLKRSKKIYNLAIKNFLYTNFENKSNVLNRQVLRELPLLLRAALGSIDHYVNRSFTDYRLRQIMEYPMVFLGTSPFEAPALYSLMSHMDFEQGVFYPQGGLHTVIEALEAIGKSLGVSYHYNAPTEKIIVENGKAQGIQISGGEKIKGDIVISNADLHFTEMKLLHSSARTFNEKYWAKRQAGPSALLIYLGVKGSLPNLTHHNLLFTKDWHANFEAIFKQKTWPDPASIYVCKPSQSDETVAPKGHENLFVLVPVPASLNVDANHINKMAEKYLDQIADMIAVPDLKDRVVVKKIVGPQDFSSLYNAWNGTALGLSHRLNQSALFRPANRSKKVKNLYYVGGNTTPGVGLPMCLISAELVYKRLLGDKSSGRIAHLEALPHV